jgi:hypothetical protein
MKLFSFQRQYCRKNKKHIPWMTEYGLILFQIVAALEKPMWRQIGHRGIGTASL